MGALAWVLTEVALGLKKTLARRGRGLVALGRLRGKEDHAGQEFGANIIGEHLRSTATLTGPTAGLLLEATGILGPQYCRKNHFTLANYGLDNGASDTDLPGIVAASRFDIDPLVALEAPNPVSPGMGWFFSNPLCSSVPANHCGGEELRPDKDYLTDEEMAIIMDNQTYTDPTNVSDWEGRRQVLAKLLRYPVLKSESDVANTFFNAQANSSATMFAQWDESVNQAMQISDINQTLLEDTRSRLSALVGSLDDLDRTLTNLDEVMSASQDFFESRYTILSEMGDVQTEEDRLLDEINATRTIALDDCESALRSLPQSTQYEVNQIFLNGILLKYGKRLPLSAEDIANLQSIAMQCPNVAGNTSSKAANWLTPGDLARQIWETGETPVCDSEERSVHAFIQESEPCRIWPNPVESLINIGFNANFSGDIAVYAINGQQPLFQKTLTDARDAQLDTEHLASGVYILTTYANDGQKFSRKFVVVK